MRSPLAVRESLLIALRALLTNKGRGVLTTLGIIIGIVAVVTTMTAVNGLQNRFRESLSAMGTDVIYVSRMPWVVMNDFFRYRNRPPITQTRRFEETSSGMRKRPVSGRAADIWSSFSLVPRMVTPSVTSAR
jgi:ABC-type antimicrobial peptide transport system permease subunit